MTTYNTGNPIGSTDARDRLDNSENLDFAVNSLSHTFVDRFGVTRDTLEGIYQKSAYYRAGTFDAGYTLTNNRQTLAYGNVEYSWSGAFPKVVSAGSTPATSGGIGAGAWVDRTDVTLRSDLNVVVKVFESVADMIADESLVVGQKCRTLGYYTVGDGGGNDYIVVAAATGTDDGGSYIDLSGSGFQAKGLFGSVVNVRQFGAVGDDSTDNTGSIQAAIDYCLSNSIYDLFIPDGVYQFTTLRLYALSGVDRAARGKFKLRGTGRLMSSDLLGSNSDVYGTILKSTQASGNCIVVADGNGLQRNVTIEALTVLSSSDGYAVYSNYCPDFIMKSVSIGVSGSAGSALFVKNSWLGKMIDCLINHDQSTVSAGDGLVFESGIFAGVFTVRDCQIDGFNNTVNIIGNSNFANIRFENSAIQRFNNIGVRCTAPIWNLSFDDCYMETGSGVHILYLNHAGIANFEMNNTFFLGGDANNAWLTGSVIKIDACNKYSIRNTKYFRCYTPLLEINTNTQGELVNVDVTHDNSSAIVLTPLYVIQGSGAFLPTLSGEFLTGNVSKLQWYNPSTHRIQRLSNYAIVPYEFGVDDFVQKTLVAAVYDMANDKPRPIAAFVKSASGGGASVVRLPTANSVKGGDMRIIANDPTSLNVLNLRNGQGATNIVSLAIGEVATCYADPVNNKWIVSVGALSYGG